MILIPFSSGLDSTTLVYNALEKKEQFKVCYINIKNNVYKTAIEKQQREKIIKLFEKKYNTHIPDNIAIGIDIDCNRIVSLPQLPAWIMGLLYLVDSNVTEVRIGYCMNDDAVSYIDDIKKIWKSYQSVCECKLPKLTFPLLKLKKSYYQKKLPSDILQEVYFCESPSSYTPISKKTNLLKNENITWRDCGHCGSCERAKYDGIFLSYERNISIDSKEGAKFISKLSDIEPIPTTFMEETEMKSGEPQPEEFKDFNEVK